MNKNSDNNNSQTTNAFTDLSLHVHSYETLRNSLTSEPSMQLSTALEEYYYLSYTLKMLSSNYNSVVRVINNRNESEKKHLFFKDNNSSYPYIIHSLSTTASSVYNFLQPSSAFCKFIFGDQTKNDSIFLDISFKKMPLNYSYQVDLNITINKEIPTESFQKDGLLILEFFVIGKCNYTPHDDQSILKTYELFGLLKDISLHKNFDNATNLAKAGAYNISFRVDQESEQFFVVSDSMNAQNKVTPTYKHSKDYPEDIPPSPHFDSPTYAPFVIPSIAPSAIPTSAHPTTADGYVKIIMSYSPPTTHDSLQFPSIFKSFFYILNAGIKNIGTMCEMITFSIAAFSQLCFGSAVEIDNAELEESQQSLEKEKSDKNPEYSHSNVDFIEEKENDFVLSIFCTGFVISTALATSMYYYTITKTYFFPTAFDDDFTIGIIDVSDFEDLV